MAEQHGAQIFKLPEEGEQPDSIDVRRLPHLISAAGVSKGGDRTALASQINNVLIAMRGPGHEEAESRVLVVALDEHRFDGLNDESGRSCRKEAVETLLACGFPHALKVSHEDLQFVRTWTPPLPEIDGGVEDDWKTPGGWAHPLLRWRGLGLFLTLAGQGAFGVTQLMAWQPSGAASLGLITGLLSVMMSAFFAVSRPNTDTQGSFGTALVLLAIIQGAAALSNVPLALLGVAGTLAGLLACFGPQYQPLGDPPKPGDWDYRDNNNNFFD